MRIRFFILFMLSFITVQVMAQSFSPTVVYTDVEGESFEGSYPNDMEVSEIKEAPMHAEFRANGTDIEGCTVTYEWSIRVDTTMQNPEEAVLVLHRQSVRDSVLTYDFKMKGKFYIAFKALAVKDGQSYPFPLDADSTVFTISLSGSELVFPNTFIPDDPDGHYNIFRAVQDKTKSIVDFHAMVFTRWGMKVASWDDVKDGWDGKIGGRYAKNGAYYLVVNARGSEGRVYHIRKTINVLNYTEESSESGGSDN